MNTSNYPTDSSGYQDPYKKSNAKNVMIAILAIAFIGTWGYLLINKKKTDDVITQNQTQSAKVTDEKSDIRRNFDQALARLDSIPSRSATLKGELPDKNTEFANTKSQIPNILTTNKAPSTQH